MMVLPVAVSEDYTHMAQEKDNVRIEFASRLSGDRPDSEELPSVCVVSFQQLSNSLHVRFNVELNPFDLHMFP